MSKDPRFEESRMNDILPRDPEKAVMDVINRIKRLIGVYERETAALEQSDIRTFSSLQDEKIHIATLYESALRQIISRRAEISTINAHLKSQLRDLQEEFGAITRRNLDALDRVGKSTKRLAEMIIKSACRDLQGQNATSYTEAGTTQERRAGLSIGISQSA
ncbi:MAG: hypothetical protein L6Q57_04025 [Alphaproteobacteria bacterium]|nr:hypothetical protein [Alphaproteobacteria bacterium]